MTQETKQATARPWVNELGASMNHEGAWQSEVRTDLGELVAVAYGNSNTGDRSAESRAALIVRAVNAHDALVAALEAIQARLVGEWDHPALVAYGPCREVAEIDTLEITRAALALVRGSE